MRTKIEIDSITRNQGKVFGNIYFFVEESFFPEKGWNDFLVIILNWWCSAIKRLLNNQNIQDEFLFMDGPFAVKVVYSEEGLFHFVFLKGDEIVLEHTKVPAYSFLIDFLAEVNVIIRYFKKCNWSDKEIDELKDNYREIKLLLKKNFHSDGASLSRNR